VTVLLVWLRSATVSSSACVISTGQTMLLLYTCATGSPVAQHTLSRAASPPISPPASPLHVSHRSSYIPLEQTPFMRRTARASR
jgi:hypothetical protein